MHKYFIVTLFWLISATATQIYAHRGGAEIVPENSTMGIALAGKLPVDVIDIDVVLTADEQLVLYHDLDFNPNTTRMYGQWVDVSRPISTFTLSELQNFDVGCLRGEEAARRKNRISHPNVKLISLEDFMKVTPKPLQIEIKADPRRPDIPNPRVYAEAIDRAFKAAKPKVSIEVHSFHWGVLRAIKALGTPVRLSYITSQAKGDNSVNIGENANPLWTNGTGNIANASEPDLVHQEGAETWCPNYVDLTHEKFIRARELGLRVVTWTVNDEAVMYQLLKMGVDGIITDRPDIALGVRSAFELTR